MMTRKHFIAIADILNGLQHGDFDVVSAVYALAVIFQQDNPAFDQQRFFDAVFNEKNGPSVNPVPPPDRRQC